MPIEWGIFLTATLLLAATAVIVYALATLNEWISSRIGVYRNRQIIAGALRNRLENGNYKVIPFIFDETEDDVLETDHIEAEMLDEELTKKFADKDEVVLEIRH